MPEELGEESVQEQGRMQREIQWLQATGANRAIVLETANQVALDILSSQTGVNALHHIAEAARRLSHAQYAALGVARPGGQGGLLEFVTTGLTMVEEAMIGPRPTGHGILGLLLERADPLRIDNLGTHPASIGFPHNHPPMQSFLGVPLRRGDTTLGSLYLTNKEGEGNFTEADEIAVQALGAHAAVAIHNLHLLTRQNALVSRFITIQEEERHVIAYDLHDGLTQYVMASHAHLESFRRARKSDQPSHVERAERELEQGLHYLKEAVFESRRLVNGLRLLALEDLGLVGAVEQLILEEKERTGWTDVEFITTLEGTRYTKTLETTVYRVIQEAFNNVRKHAETDQVRITLKETTSLLGKTELMLEVKDEGKGFIMDHNKGDDYSHLGLQGIIERINLLGGTSSIQSVVGKGTTIQATFPITKTLPEKREEEKQTL